MRNIPFCPRATPRRLAAQILLIPFYKWGSWSQERPSDLSKASRKQVAELGLGFSRHLIPTIAKFGNGFWIKEWETQAFSSWRHWWRCPASLLEGYPFLSVLECCPESWTSLKPLEVWDAQRAGKTRQYSSQLHPPGPLPLAPYTPNCT